MARVLDGIVGDCKYVFQTMGIGSRQVASALRILNLPLANDLRHPTTKINSMALAYLP
jgi:hypothetical protein